ncbi:unnamed protein product [Ostreobium quekettii]|uniref:Ureidoglycolate hydrolase n=1 Tax=Ostreobium quekettii TaxID=121088 RepID=A0A8S1JFN6_9CHLO|nr:unnamed protein product [Ostreobium quekettii]|eukprot:evm.model.scf_78.5 EVM.evm.TU.scf_78.5   scf_78:110315-111509(+)
MAQAERIKLNVTPLTPETFRPFGQVIGATEDGKQFDSTDAQLVLDKGTPRFYIMRIPRRGLSFDNITFHQDVTQCLGAVTHKPWYMAVAAPGVSPYPSEADISVFRVPPTVFLKLECGTWHAGPLFADSEFMDFYNLELADTNIVDHHTHRYAEDCISFEIGE